MLPLGLYAEPNIAQLALAARIGAEMGADIIKLRYLGPADEYRQVTQACFAPILALGGRARSAEVVLQEVHEALQAGVAGVAFGRNVWQHDNATEMTHLIVEAVHGSEQVGTA